MIVLDSKLNELEPADLLAWVIAKLLLMGFKEEDTVQVNL